MVDMPPGYRPPPSPSRWKEDVAVGFQDAGAALLKLLKWLGIAVGILIAFGTSALVLWLLYTQIDARDGNWLLVLILGVGAAVIWQLNEIRMLLKVLVGRERREASQQ